MNLWLLCTVCFAVFFNMYGCELSFVSEHFFPITHQRLIWNHVGEDPNGRHTVHWLSPCLQKSPLFFLHNVDSSLWVFQSTNDISHLDIIINCFKGWPNGVYKNVTLPFTTRTCDKDVYVRSDPESLVVFAMSYEC